MAEIHVEKKRGPAAWVWVLVILVVLACVGYYLWYSGIINFSMNTMPGASLAYMSLGGPNGA